MQQAITQPIGSKQAMITMMMVITLYTTFMLPSVSAIYVEMQPGKSICFSEDLSPNTPVQITYGPPVDVALSTLVVRDPFGGIITEEKNFPAGIDHKTHFKTRYDVSGWYEICIMPTQFSINHQYGAPIHAKVEVEIDREHANKDQHESKEYVDKLGELLQDVKSKIDFIGAEQYYFKDRESRFRLTTDDTYERCFWIGLGKFTLLVFVTVWQLSNLRSFFKKKKLI